MSEMPWSLVRVEDGVLRPVARYDLDLITSRYKPGTTLRAKFAQSRSPKHHRLYWAVLHKVVEVTQLWLDAESLNKAVKTQLRMFGDGILLLDGSVRFELASIDYAHMDQGAFKHFFDSAMLAIGEATCLDMADVIDEVKGEIGWSRDDENAFKGVLSCS